ncbi:hypothetical protein ACFX5K_03450 [Rickettsiales bacterium LUAb2]
MSADSLHHDDNKPNSKVIFGFWIYIITDALMFAILFAVYGVLGNQIFGSLSIKDIVNLPTNLTQTILFMLSTFTLGVTVFKMQNGNSCQLYFWLVVTFIIGLIFAVITYCGLADIVKSGHSWKDSAFLSSYFALVGIFIIHALVGLLWILVLIIQIAMKRMSTSMLQTRLVCLSLFWGYLNIIWIVMFSIVYLLGAL